MHGPVRRYKNSRLSEDDILRCLYSISDNNSYLLFNRCSRFPWLVAFHSTLAAISTLSRMKRIVDGKSLLAGT